MAFQVEMAHQVLSKDMSELVNTMKLAQQYSTTTLDGTYRKWVPLLEIRVPVLHCYPYAVLVAQKYYLVINHPRDFFSYKKIYTHCL